MKKGREKYGKLWSDIVEFNRWRDMYEKQDIVRLFDGLWSLKLIRINFLKAAPQSSKTSFVQIYHHNVK